MCVLSRDVISSPILRVHLIEMGHVGRLHGVLPTGGETNQGCKGREGGQKQKDKGKKEKGRVR